MSMENRPTYGGQAVMEGVMIKGQRYMSVAVRRPDGNIAFQCQPLSPLFTGRLRQFPVFRGVIVLAETLVLGMKALSYSANVSMQQEADEEGEAQELGKGSIATMIFLALLFAIGLFFLVPLFASRPLEGALGSDLVSNVAEGVIRLVIFLAYILLIGKMGDIRRVFMYHGAEHMTVHAQERGDPLEVDEIRKYPAAHPRCGTAFLLVVMVVAIVVFAFVPRSPFWWLIGSRVILIPLIAGISYELIRLSGRHAGNPLVRLISGPSLALQALTTRQPDDDQIEVAIVAMAGTIKADQGQAPLSDGDS